MNDVPLDDEAILTLLKYMEWDVQFDDLDKEWFVRPIDQNFMGYAAFMTLRSALEYAIDYQEMYK